jgi:hypothetical protein
MRLTQMYCDGCGRKPNLWEWMMGEFSATGYQDWRHPGITFKEAGCPITYETRNRSNRLFLALFGRPIPDELSYLCPNCQTHAALELPGLIATDPGDAQPQQAPGHHYFGR